MGFKFNPLTGQFDLTGSSSSGALTGVTDSDSIDFSVSGGTDVTGDIKLSSVSEDSNNQLVNLDIQTDGIRAQIPDLSIQTAALNLLGPVVLTDNNSGTVFSFTAASNKFTFVDYSIERNSNVRCGRILVVTDGSSASISDAGYVELSPIGINLGVSISVGVVSVTYSASSTGFNGSFKYSLKQWS